MRLLGSCNNYQEYVDRITSFIKTEGNFELVAKNCLENINDGKIQAKVIAALNAIDGVAGETNSLDNAIKSKLDPFLEVGVLLGALTDKTRNLTKDEMALLAKNTRINPLEESTEKDMIDILTSRELLATIAVSQDMTEPTALVIPALFFKIKQHYNQRKDGLKEDYQREAFAREMIQMMKNNTISNGVPRYISYVLEIMARKEPTEERKMVS